MGRLLIYPKLCIGCKACEIACAREHNGINNIEVYVMDEARISIPYTCLHCTNPLCVTKCPVNALNKSSDVVLIDHSKCTKCLECVKICPYNSIKVIDKLGLITKCDLCYHRLLKNLPPACASTCPTGAITYIEVNMEKESFH
ncbi:MAG: 4Fe-4S dicluster domain-containing protein [Desulfurococcaceae archaeon]